MDADDEAAVEAREPEPILPAMGEDGGDHGDDLEDGFKLADLAGVDRKSLARGDRTQAAYQELSADDQHGNPGRHNPRTIRDQDDVGGRDHQLVRERVEQHAHGGDLPPSPGQVAVEPVRDAGQDEQAGSC